MRSSLPISLPSFPHFLPPSLSSYLLLDGVPALLGDINEVQDTAMQVCEGGDGLKEEGRKEGREGGREGGRE